MKISKNKLYITIGYKNNIQQQQCPTTDIFYTTSNN